MVVLRAAHLWCVGSGADCGDIFLYPLCGADHRPSLRPYIAGHAPAAPVALAQLADRAACGVDNFTDLSHIFAVAFAQQVRASRSSEMPPRARILAQLKQTNGRHLVIVIY